MNRTVKLVISGALGLAVGLAWGFTRKPIVPPLSLPSQPSAPMAPTHSPAAGVSSTGAGASALATATTAQDLERLLVGHPGTALLDFHAEWCKPCKELEPRLVELAAKRPDLLVISIDVMAAEELAKAYNADLLPLLVRMEGGKETARQSGAPSLDDLTRWLVQPTPSVPQPSPQPSPQLKP